MKRTFSIKLDTADEQAAALVILQKEFARACDLLAPLAAEAYCVKQVKLHHLGYCRLREEVSAIGAQQACNAGFAVTKICPFVQQPKIPESSRLPCHHLGNTIRPIRQADLHNEWGCPLHG